MKKIFIAVLTLSLFACKKMDIKPYPAKVPPVTELQYRLEGDSVVLSWSLPKGFDKLSVIVVDSTSEKTLPVNSTSTKIGVIETNKDYRFLVKLADTANNRSTGEIIKFRREGAAAIKNVSAEQNEDGIKFAWSAPDLPVTKVTIKIGSLTAEVPGTATQYQFDNIPVGEYMASFVTTNSSNQVSHAVYIPVKVGPTKLGYLGTYADSTTMMTMGDDDIVAGARWFFTNYPKAKYISFNDIKNNNVDLAQYRVLWWNYDVENTNEIPVEAADPVVVSRIADFYKKGGNLLFNQFAVRYFWNLGRMTAPYAMIIGHGRGFSNDATWGVGVKVGKKQDKRSHPLYQGIQLTTTPDGRVFFPTIGPGWREDHNAVIIDIPQFHQAGFADDVTYNRFQNENGIDWIGQWEGIPDYWMAGVMEMKPKGEFQGTALYIGIGGIEWNQNSGRNLYQSTIERMYKNGIDYLRSK